MPYDRDLPPGSPPLDDLLLENPSTYEPPANLMELFLSPGSMWNLTGHLFFKTGFEKGTDEYRAYMFGWYAFSVNMWLRTGWPFMYDVPEFAAKCLADRCRQFGRVVVVDHYRAGTVSLRVSGHPTKPPHEGDK